MSDEHRGAGREPPHLLLVGGGHAHVQVFHDWLATPPRARLTLLVDRELAVYSGMVPGFVAGQYTRDELAFDLASWAGRLGAELVLDRATALDLQGKRVECAGGEPIPFDVCSFNIGSSVHGLELPGVRDHALVTRPIGGFVSQVVPRLRSALERRAGETLRLIVVGGGAAGVELALCLEARARAEGSGDDQPAPTVETHVVCASDGVLPGAVAGLRRRVEREFRRRSIVTHLRQTVVEVLPDEVVLASGAVLPADLVVWATGAAPQLEAQAPSAPTVPTVPTVPSTLTAPTDPADPTARMAPVAKDASGWIPVRDTLQHVGHPDVFAVGDCAGLVEDPATPKAGVYAVRQGPVLAHNLRQRLTGADALRTYRPQAEFLTLLNLGDGRAAGSKWGLSFGGRWALRLKDRIDRAFMTRYG